jgi:excisionase family DNA binding protein
VRAAPEPLLTVADVAGRLGVSKATVYKLCDAGALVHVRVANAIRVTVSAVEVFVAGGGAGGPKGDPREALATNSGLDA